MQRAILLAVALAFNIRLGECFLSTLKNSLESQNASKEKAKILTEFSSYFQSCHHVHLFNSNQSSDSNLIGLEFQKSTAYPILSYNFDSLPETPFSNILRSIPSSPNIDNHKIEYCVTYFMTISLKEIDNIIQNVLKSDFIKGASKYLVLFIDEELTQNKKDRIPLFIHNSLRLFIISRTTANQYEINEVCLFCDSGEPAMRKIGDWRNSSLKMFKTFSMNLPEDFQNHEFSGVTLQFPPYVDYEKSGDKIIPKDSLDINLMRTIAEKHNFVFKLIEPVDKQWGYQLPNGSYSGVMGTVIRREADFSMDLLITLQRSAHVTFTTGYLEDPLTFSFSRPKPLPQWLSLLRPFQMQVWLCLFFALLLLTPIFRTIVKYSKLTKQITFFNASFQLYGALVSQTFPKRSHNTSKLFIGFWLLFSFVATKLYLGNLMAHLTIPTMSPTINTLEELIMSDFLWGVQDNGGSDYELFKTSDVPLYQTIFKNMDLCSGLRGCLLRSYREQYAFISWRNYMRQEIQLNFKDKRGNPVLHLARQNFFPSDIGFALQKGSFLKEPFDRTILRLLEAGLVSKWLNDVIESSRASDEGANEIIVEDTTNSGESQNLTLYHVQGIFIIYSLGICSAGIVFILEIIKNKYGNSNY